MELITFNASISIFLDEVDLFFLSRESVVEITVRLSLSDAAAWLRPRLSHSPPLVLHRQCRCHTTEDSFDLAAPPERVLDQILETTG